MPADLGSWEVTHTPSLGRNKARWTRGPLERSATARDPLTVHFSVLPLRFFTPKVLKAHNTKTHIKRQVQLKFNINKN